MRLLHITLICCLASSLLCSQTPSPQSPFPDGDAAMRQGQWHDAALAFQKTVEADPSSAQAHAKLSNALAFDLMPGGRATSSADLPALARILDEQRKAADLAPQDPRILAQLARIQNAFAVFSTAPDEQTKNCELSFETMRRAIELAPDNPAFRFDLASMEIFALTRAFGQTPASSADQTKSPRISDDTLRHGFTSQFGLTADDSIAQTEKLVQLQPNYAFAKLLTAEAYRLRASLADSDNAAAPDVQKANEWAANFRAQSNPSRSPMDDNGLIAALRNPSVIVGRNPEGRNIGVIGGFPPPPTQFPPGAQRIGGNVMEANLIKKVNPIYPLLAKSARVQGVVEFTAWIDPSGHVATLQLVRGHPLLVNAAKVAVLQWEYRPVLLNGKPVDVITDIIVNFTLSNNPTPPPPAQE